MSEETVEDYDFRSVDNIRVIARFRPPNETEKREERLQSLKNVPPEFVSVHEVKLYREEAPSQPYICSIDHIFNTETDQKKVFGLVGRPMLQAVLEGYNATIFAYGQTGSGKTHTMFGPEERKDEADLGLVPRCCTYLFQQLKKKQTDSVEAEIKEFQVQGEFIQIYKEEILDLLDPNKRQKLKIKHNFQTDTPYVEHLKSMALGSITDLLLALTEANKNRKVASHKLNAHSSRSHMLVMLTIEQQMKDGAIKRSKLNFGDLAGSEDVAKALGPNPDPERLKEAIGINTSLTALTTAISYLAKSQRPSYRSSALTHILQDSLGGNSKTTMIVNASPHIMNRHETVRTLRFAQTAKTVKNKARVNKELTRAQMLQRIQELEAENASLVAKNAELMSCLEENGVAVPESAVQANGGDNKKGNANNEKKPAIKKQASMPVSEMEKATAQASTTSNGAKKAFLELDVASNVTSSVKPQSRVELSIADHVAVTDRRGSTTSIQTLVSEIEKLRKALQTELQNHQETTQKNIQLETELEFLQKQMDDTRGMMNEQQETISSHTRVKQTLEDKIKTITEELNETNKRMNEEAKKLDKQIELLRSNVQTERKEKNILQTQLTEITLQNEFLIKQNSSLEDQLRSLKTEVSTPLTGAGGGESGVEDKMPISSNPTPKKVKSAVSTEPVKKVELVLGPEEQNMNASELLMHRFADAGVNDHRLAPEQKMQKMSQVMGELSDDIGEVMDKWLDKSKVRADRKKSKALVYQVRQLIGHFGVAANQLKQTEESYQNDMRFQMQKKDKEIERLKKDNARVLQLQDDLAEKDEIIQSLKKELDDIRFEREQWLTQKLEMESAVDEVRHQVSYLEQELNKSRSMATLPLDQANLQAFNNEIESKLKKPKSIMEADTEEDKNDDIIGQNDEIMEIESVESDDSENSSENNSKRSSNKSDKKKEGGPDKAVKKQRSMTEWRVTLKEGDKIDACDDGGLWWEATVMEGKGDLLRVRFEGWGTESDEWIPRTSTRLAVFRSKHSQKKEGKKVIKQGYLEKEGKMFRTWRKRFFILTDDGCLTYYENEADSGSIGHIKIDDTIDIKIVQFGKKKPHGFQLTADGRTWKFVCETEQEVKDWLHAIDHVKTGVLDEAST